MKNKRHLPNVIRLPIDVEVSGGFFVSILFYSIFTKKELIYL
ncbi:hypothetical protein SAMN06265219_105171 [Gracilimonas mengyeensis]|uniref:Uncharacterized protein n=1 Tax=Gracilimonas mengyeensis TaxID=1302730 RepID=A0A521CHQ3_9BACT|nr:hypothetical protein SAMN06265219_105171 [Gracilimonas mengyeensis]